MRIAILTSDGREVLRSYTEKQPSFGTAPEALLQGMKEIPGLEVHIISCLQQPVSSPEKLANNIWFHSLHVPKFGWMRTGYQGCVRAVRKKLKEIQPDIVHGQGTERDCAISAVFSGFPNVVTIHGNMRAIAKIKPARPFSFDWLAAQLERITIPRSRGIVCITNHTRKMVVDLARRTWLVPNAVDAGFFDIDPSPDEFVTILCVGNISLVKNQNNFIRALDPLAATKKFRVIFLGSTNQQRPCDQEFFQLLATRAWCVYGGFADRTQLKHYLRQAAFLVLPSLEENCPMSILEAMAAGVPVLAAKVGGVPDLIEEGKTGLFCDPLNPQSMEKGVSVLLTDLPTARKMAEYAKQVALRRFHPSIIAQRHLEIYREVLSTVS